ncbi:MAG: efflux RND transporter periplasmic adaptor subunit [Acetobacteraceae bacterium]|nr:efflux RND transporter periplasmic adaptor subunit [Acetobacteraceae bacterium]
MDFRAPSGRIVLACIAAVALAAGWAAWAQSSAPPPASVSGPPPAAVVTAEVRRADAPLMVSANGVVEAAAVVAVRTRVDGAIEKLLVQEGQSVRHGQPLFTLDSRQNQALLAQQQAVLEKDRAMATRAAADATRYRALGGEGSASQQRLEQAIADAAAAAATVKADEAQIAQTRLAIDYATITAPIDGRIGTLPMKEGAFLRAAENVVLATVTQIDPIEVRFAIPDRYLPMLLAHQADIGLPVVVSVSNDPRGPVAGSVSFIDSQVDAATGTIALKASMANPETRLWPGQYVQVELRLATDTNALTVPAAAVQQGPGGAFVWVVAGGTAAPVAVRVARVGGGVAVLEQGPEAGTRVVVEGQQRLTSGSRVIERRPEAAGAAVRR